MAQLSEYLADIPLITNAVARRPQPGKRRAKSNYIAFALIPKNTFPDFGGSYTPPSGSATTLTGANIAGFIKALCIAGVGAYFFGNGTVNGKKGKPKEMMESMAFGTRTTARPTGEIEDGMSFDLKDLYYNVEFWNKVRFQDTEYDIYVFTDKTVQVIRWDWHEPVFQGIGHEIGGDITKDIVGSLGISYTSETGELVPVGGVTDSMLIDADVKLTFGTSTFTGLVAVAGVANAYTCPAATAGSLTPVLIQTGVAGLKYAIYKNANEPVGADPVTINTATGVVTKGAGLATGIYKYTIVAENATGVFGSMLITINQA